VWGGEGEGSGRGEKWPKYCMHIWIKEIKKNWMSINVCMFKKKKVNVLLTFIPVEILSVSVRSTQNISIYIFYL
jgi:hypothetical protein